MTGLPGDSSLWADSTTFLMVDGQKGIFGYGNVGYGDQRATHVNLGVACTTGTSGSNYKYCTVGGGYENTASGNWGATVGGGYLNNANAMLATVGGGYLNNASLDYATVGGGGENTASNVYSIVGGGYLNNASGYAATVGGGRSNIASGEYATVGGGYENTASDSSATVGGGRDNDVSGLYSAIPGGQADTVSGDYSFAFGNGVSVSSNYYAVFFDDTHPGRMGINNETPTSALDVGGDIEVGAADAFYFGDPTTDGTWRITRSGTDLVIELRVSGAWVTKLAINP